MTHKNPLPLFYESGRSIVPRSIYTARSSEVNFTITIILPQCGGFWWEGSPLAA